MNDSETNHPPCSNDRRGAPSAQPRPFQYCVQVTSKRLKSRASSGQGAHSEPSRLRSVGSRFANRPFRTHGSRHSRCASRSGAGLNRRSLSGSTICAYGQAFRGPAGRSADRRSAVQAVPAIFLCWRYALSLRFAQRCRSEDRRSQSGGGGGESNPRPKVFCNDVYMHIRVVAGNPRPEAPFPLSVPHRINPANRGSEPIPCAHRRLGKTAGKARLGRRPFPPGRRGQEERGYLSSQCQFSVGFCFVSTVTRGGPPTCSRCFIYPRRTQYAPPLRAIEAASPQLKTNHSS